MHLLQVEYTCSICQAKFDSNRELINHKLVHKDEKRSYLCRKCSLAFTEHFDWLQHEFDHKQRESFYKCPECTKYFKLKFVAQKHLGTHFNLNLKCDLCSDVFKSEERLRIHALSHDSTFECCECGLVCKDKKNLRYHMLSHTGLRPHQCLFCGLGFKTPTAKNIHTRKHTGEQHYRYNCKECNKKFNDQSSLHRHKCTTLVDTRDKVECEVCKKNFFPWTLAGHMKLHANEREYKCTDCEAAYNSYASLKQHVMYRHSNEKPIKCTEEGCEAGFKQKKDLYRHLFNLHKKDVPYFK